MLPAMEPATSTSRLAAKASDRRLANTRWRIRSMVRTSSGRATAMRVMIRSANPAAGLMSGSAATSETISASVSARSRQVGQPARCSCAAGARAPASHASRSSGVRWGPETGLISGASYGPKRGEVSFFAQVGQGLPELVPGAVDVRLDGAERQVQDLCDLLVRPPLDMAQENARPIFRPQPADGGLDGAAQLL